MKSNSSAPTKTLLQFSIADIMSLVIVSTYFPTPGIVPWKEEDGSMSFLYGGCVPGW